MLTKKIKFEDIVAVRERDAREEGWERGWERGREEGLERGRELAARNALAEGASLEFVQKITGLDIRTLQSLSNQ